MDWWYVPQLDAANIDTLRRYKYSGEDRSIMRQYVMNRMYNRLVYAFPAWVAPNTITLSGFILIIISHLQLVYYSVDLTQDAPRAVYAFACWALFSYMVLDNLDGKQARRTNSSSALGQLFDHGCDALNVTLSGMSLLATLQMGCNTASMIMVLTLGHTMLFMATLEEYMTGSMILRQFNGPNEGIMLLCGIYAFTAFMGPSMWRTDVQHWLPQWAMGWRIARILAPLRVHDVIATVSHFATVHAVAGNMIGIAQHARQTGQNVLVSVLQTIRYSLPLALYSMMYLPVSVVAPRNFAHYGVALMWTSGGAMYDVITRMMLARLAGSAYPWLPVLLVPSAIGCAAVVGGEWGMLQRSVVDGAVWGAVAMVAAYNTWRARCVIRQMCEALGVRCFSLKEL
ncbi:ethanolaminephosphotransferase [Gracilaria domingensis]|nr:ethanolaminephosphotransferase [Gracilaria domingensis]